MILDTSSIITVAVREPGFRIYAEAMSRADHCRVSAVTFVELSIVMERQFEAEVAQKCDALLGDIGVLIEPVTVEQAYLARQAFHDFGKGRHAAGLNFGDCFALRSPRAPESPSSSRGTTSGRPTCSQHCSPPRRRSRGVGPFGLHYPTPRSAAGWATGLLRTTRLSARPHPHPPSPPPGGSAGRASS